jgi:hypothetical protein
MAGGMNAAPENFLGAFYLEIIGDAIAAVMVAQEHFISWMLKVKVLHGTSLACDVEQCHPFERRSFAPKADPAFQASMRTARLCDAETIRRTGPESVRQEAPLMYGIAIYRFPVAPGFMSR